MDETVDVLAEKYRRAWNSGYNSALADQKVLITTWIAEHVADEEFDPHSLLSYLAEKQPPKNV